MGTCVTVTAPVLRAHLEALFSAWGMREEDVAITADIMVETDLRGIDSHGVCKLPMYDAMRRQGTLCMAPEVRVLRETPVTGLIDAGAGLGHAVSVRAMNMAVDKCRASGVAVVCVRNSHHFGAAGIYAEIAAGHGMVGMVTTSTRHVSVVPSHGGEPVLGTNPVAFAAPARRNPPFLLDMATSVVAAGRIKLHALRRQPLPLGWVVDGQGWPVTDPAQAMRQVHEGADGGLMPLGGTRELGGHKGYGLAVMSHILGGVLTGGSFSPVRNRREPGGDPDNVGHLFLAIDPRAFRSEGEFEEDLDEVIDTLHATRPRDPRQPVLVAGDPERLARAERQGSGIPLPLDLLDELRSVAERAGVPFSLADEVAAPA